jgi:hypothetical protein
MAVKASSKGCSSASLVSYDDGYVAKAASDPADSMASVEAGASDMQRKARTLDWSLVS